MKHLKYITGVLLISFLAFTSCQEDEIEVGDITAPTNIDISVTYIDQGQESAAPGLGSGEVQFSASADGAISFHFVIEGQTKLQNSGSVSHIFATLGENTYSVTAIAYGVGGISSSKTIDVEVLSLYEPPADLLDMLYGNGTKIWRIKNEANNHFGLGAPNGSNPFEYYGAPIDAKAGVGMYDDRYIFNQDGTFTHIVDSTNDDPTTDPSGTVFGREILVNELDANGGGGGDQNGADIENYNYADYSGQWSLTAPNDVETLSLSGLGFIGYYVGGDHKYQIISRSLNEMVIKTTDGNGQFDWGFTLIAD